MRLIDWLDRGAAMGSDRPCLRERGETLTYGEVVAETRRIAAALCAHEVGRGSRAAVLGPNSASSFLAVLGILRSGATWIPVNVRSPAEELAFVLRAASCEALIYDAELGHVVQAIQGAVPSLRWVVSLDGLARSLPGDPEALEDWVDDPHAEAVLAFTGGTTGQPKGVVMTSQNLTAMTLAILTHIELGASPVYLAAAPLTHAAGALCFPVLAAGGCIVIEAAAKPDLVLDAIERERVTFLYLPPTVIYLMLGDPSVRERDYSSLRSFVYSAAPMAPERIREAMDAFGPVMVQAYGQTEAAMICTVMTAADHVEAVESGNVGRFASAGRPSVVARVAAMDDDLRLLPAGEVGEIVVRGDLVMRGYLDAPEATAEASAGGWHHTGDVGYIDDDGFVYLVDRKKDMIVTGGFNVFSAEVEQIVLAHPAVSQCAVVGAPDDKWGEVVTAVVELRPGMSLDAQELIEWSKGSLGSVKAPKRVEVWDSLPRSAVGKILKRDVRQVFWAGRSRAI